jgi:hypothetical protein
MARREGGLFQTRPAKGSSLKNDMVKFNLISSGYKESKKSMLTQS